MQRKVSGTCRSMFRNSVAIFSPSPDTKCAPQPGSAFSTHDLNTFADRYGLALRGGHHCNQPLMRRFGVTGTSRASFYFYNTREEIDRTIDILQRAVGFFK